MTIEEIRRKENAELIAKMRRGEDFKLIDAAATWWPPRPIIKKDWDEIRRLAEEEKPK